MKDNSASITGQITLDGKPTAALEVALLPQHHFNRDNAIASGKTDSTGRYIFDCLPMGRYWLKVDTPGYFDPFNWDEEGPGRNVSVADGEFVVNADLNLILGAVITGRVTDPDGRPVVGEHVELTMIDRLPHPDDPFDLPGEEGDFFTDSNGEYRIYGIPPGRYLVSIGVDVSKVTGTRENYLRHYHSTGQVYSDHYFEQTFHPGTGKRANAKVVDISIGAIVEGVNISVGRPIRAYTITGCVIHDETRTPIRRCYLQLGYYLRGGYGSTYMMDGESDTDENGNFRVEGLLPGRFFISAQFEDETELYCTPVEFEIKSQDVHGLEIQAHWGVELRGTVIIEGAANQEAVEKLAQLKLLACTHGPSSRRHDSRRCTVNGDGSFVIRGLRPGPVHLSLDFVTTSKYFTIVRIEYPDNAGETVSILPIRSRVSPKLPSFCPPATANDLPPVPQPIPTLSPQSHHLLPARLDESHGTITLAHSESSHPLPAPRLASRLVPQQAPITVPSELPAPRFPGDLPPLQLGEHGLSGVRLVLSYKNGSIRGHVAFNRENLDYDRGLQAGISHRLERGSWHTSTDIDPNGDFFIDGLAPGEYQISILSETKTIVVDKNSESTVSFVIEPDARCNRD